MPDSKPSRRHFLAAAATSLAASSVAARPVAASPSRVIGANDRINVAFIGVGGRGRGHVRRVYDRSQDKADVQVVALCDIYSKRKEIAREITKLQAKDVHHQYAEVLARDDVDAVYISSPDHWHAPMTLAALDAGKDVYLEKPMTYTLHEAQEVAKRVRLHKRVLQVGSQHLSDQRYHRAREVIQKGWIGRPLWTQNTYSRNSLHGEWNYHIDDEGTPQNIDWTLFQGPAPARDFNADRFFRWRKYWDYSGGIATDLFYHRLAPLEFAIGLGFPTRVSANGGIYVHKDREVPDTYATNIEYEDHYALMSASMASDAANQWLPPIIYGHEGTIQFVPGGIVVLPERQFRTKFEAAVGAPEVLIPVERQDIDDDHTSNFLDCVRSRKDPVFDADMGYKVMTAIDLGVKSYRQGKVMAFDPAREVVLDEPGTRPAYEGSGKNYDDA
ncbi:MAG: Gfo/Idh/MocA family oxidoreductase [Acidobacteria bacterium]|nr:Gfo/Idh/MocA family oxidoreductase [Acidobacteriota bacterium]